MKSDQRTKSGVQITRPIAQLVQLLCRYLQLATPFKFNNYCIQSQLKQITIKCKLQYKLRINSELMNGFRIMRKKARKRSKRGWAKLCDSLLVWNKSGQILPWL